MEAVTDRAGSVQTPERGRAPEKAKAAQPPSRATTALPRSKAAEGPGKGTGPACSQRTAGAQSRMEVLWASNVSPE